MKTDLDRDASPFLNETVAQGGAPRSWDSEPPQRREFEWRDEATLDAGEALTGEGPSDEADEVDHEAWPEHDIAEHDIAEHECHAGCAHHRENHRENHRVAMADEAWHEGEFEDDEAPGCLGEHEFRAEGEGEEEDEGEDEREDEREAGLIAEEAWSGSAEQIAFRDRVLQAHLALTRKRRGAPQRDLSATERDTVPGTGVEMRRDAAAAAGRLLAAASAELASAQQSGDADALRTQHLTASSGYRDHGHQQRLWLRYFPGYYKRTRAAREQLADGPHSDAAVAYMLRPRSAGGFGLGGRIAAPGYSNHQNGIAIDFLQERRKGHAIKNDSGDRWRARWRASWFHHWLRQHAAEHGFQPLGTEEWHWEFRAGPVARPTQDEPAARVPAAPPRATSPTTSTSASIVQAPPGTPTEHLGGLLWAFNARVLPTPVAVYCPPAARGRSEVDVLVYAHGLLNGCERPRHLPEGMVSGSPFHLGRIVAASKRPIVLVLPLLDWQHPGGAAAFGAAHPRWHALAKPQNLNALIDEALAELGRVQSARAPTTGRLVIAGHSRAYDFLEPLAQLHTDPQMQEGALARLAEVWSLDATYAGNLRHWQDWLSANPALRATVVYRPGSKTGPVGDRFYKARGGRLSVTHASEGHCQVPGQRLPALLAGPAAQPQHEFEDTWGDDELDREDLMLELEDAPLPPAMGAESEEEAEDFVDDTELSAESWGDDEVEGEGEGEDQYGHEHTHESATHQEAEFEYEDEMHAEQALEEAEAGDKAPMALPVDHPVPFAPLPPAGSHWPVRTRHPSAHLVSYMYQAPSGVVGRAGRMFLAGRLGKVNGKTVARWHVGLDLFCTRNDVVVACEPGTIVRFSHFYKAKSGQDTYKLLIAHDSGLVINYGEVREDSLRRLGLQVGSHVDAGQPIGYVSDTDMLHFETYVRGTTDSQRWWKAETHPPRELLNPTRYLLALAQGAGAASGTAAPTPSSGTSSGSATARPAAELVRFAQRVLNAAEGERLNDDGDLGPLTRTALARFRRKYGLAGNDLLDTATVTGLAQRALEELRQQSLFAQTGVLDSRTRDELAAFRAQHQLGLGATLDAATRLALTDALARRSRRVPASPAPTTSPSPATPTPRAPAGSLPTLPGLGAGHTPPTDPAAYRRFRLTTYHVVDQQDEPTGAVRIPILDAQGQVIAHGSPAFFAKLSLEGTGRLTDGRLVNVTGQKVPATHADYEPVLQWHRAAYAKGDAKRVKAGRKPAPTLYSGIVVSKGQVVQALAFHEIAASKRGVGYGVARGIAYTPFRTLAADIGTPDYDKVDPRWKGKGGLVPPGTHVYIKEYDGLALPDGSTHDGWFIVNDTGGAIFGAHFDVFTGSDALRHQVQVPAFGQVWFPGIDQRIPAGYTYGLAK